MLSVYDSKAKGYFQPLFAANTDVGIRMFVTAASDPEHPFSQNPGDYTLFELGEFDQQTGQYEQHHAPINYGTAHMFKHLSATAEAMQDNLAGDATTPALETVKSAEQGR